MIAPVSVKKSFRGSRLTCRVFARRWHWGIVAVFSILLGVSMLAGCRSDVPEMVPVKGKVTFKGGAWPKRGVVNFTPFKPAEGFPRRPGSGHFDKDGAFVATTGEFEGLIPGEYRISISCWEKEPSDDSPGVSYLPKKFVNPSQSGLTLKIEPGTSGPIVWEEDFPSASK